MRSKRQKKTNNAPAPGFRHQKKLGQNFLTDPEIVRGIAAAFTGVGAFAIATSLFLWMSPTILGLVLGEMLEQNFMSSMIKANGSFIGFLDRPIAGTLGVLTMLLWGGMLWKALPFGRRQPAAA